MSNVIDIVVIVFSSDIIISCYGMMERSIDIVVVGLIQLIRCSSMKVGDCVGCSRCINGIIVIIVVVMINGGIEGFIYGTIRFLEILFDGI